MAEDTRPEYTYSHTDYSVVCAYELSQWELLQEIFDPWLDIGVSKTHINLVANRIEFHHAAHLVRTLQEHGERDMHYYCIPSILYEVIRDPADMDLPAPE